MARQYIITEEEMLSLIDSLEMKRMKDENVNDPYRHMDDAWRNLSAKEKSAAMAAIDSLHRGFHLVVVRWAQKMGFDGYRK